MKIYEEGTTEYDSALEQGMKPVANSGAYIVATADGTKQAKTVGESIMPVMSVVWIIGIVSLVSYSLGSLTQLKKRLVSSVPYKDNIYLADHIDSPFVLGLVKPKIYLPSTMPESEYAYTILHEVYHIKRMDHLVKGLAFAALCVHWFNPLVWLAFMLSMTDMEMSCDEAVLSQMGESVKAEYSISLLGFASGKQYVPATFLAFGEVSPKARIKNVLKWKKQAVIFSAIAAVLAVFAGVLCLSNPLKKDYLEKTSSIVSNNNRNRIVAEDENYIYFVNMTEVKKISKADDSIETIYEFTDIENLVNTFEYFDGRLYFVTYNYDFISMDTDGENIIKSKLEIEKTAEMTLGGVPFPHPHVFGGDLYLLLHSPYRAYRVKPDTLEVEKADYEISEQYQTADGTIFTRKIEEEMTHLYVTTPEGEEKLFSAEDERVMAAHYTNAYVFYQAFKIDDSESQYDSLFLYRVDLDGKNKVLVKEIKVAEAYGPVQFDNEYVYINMNEEEYLKIHKKTLKEENIISVTKDLYLGFEVSNGKFFALSWTYFIDRETGEMTNFDITEEEAYRMIEEGYAFRPVKFGYLPEGLAFAEIEVNEEEEYTRIRYEGLDYKWLELYVEEVNRSSSSHRIIDDPGTYVKSYEVESEERGSIQVNLYENNVSKMPMLQSEFYGNSLYESYTILSHNMGPEEYDMIIQKLIFKE